MTRAVAALTRPARPPARAALISAGGIATALLGGALLVLMLAQHLGAPAVLGADETAKAGGLSLGVDATAWVRHGHETERPMPPSMMPGAPADGSQRLRVEVTLSNPEDRALAFATEEFRLRSADGESWAVHSSSFAAGVLRPGQLLTGDLYFDVPEGHRDLDLVWTRAGRSIRIRVVGDVPRHRHRGTLR